MPRPRLLTYCQHVLGMGHLVRSLALAEGLSETFEVEFLNGGPIAPGVRLPSRVNFTDLPPLSMDPEFRRLQTGSGTDPASTLALRRELILETFKRFSPDVVMIELFPFGRKKFSEELVPLLARIRRDAPDTVVVCSVRDILVQRPNQDRHDRRVLRLLDRYFDLVLVHGDEEFHSLADSFGPAADIGPRVEHTGFVVPSPSDDDQGGSPDDVSPTGDGPVVVASIGGGRVGVELLDAAIAASITLRSRLEHQLVVCTGPYLPDEDERRIRTAAAGHEHIAVHTFVTRFGALLEKADLSLSMAGYNTCMNLARSGVRALVLPFTGGGNDEQTIRATKLDEKSQVGLLTVADLTAERLAARMEAQLQSDPPAWSVDLDGIRRSTELIAETLAARPRPVTVPRPAFPEIAVAMEQLDAAFNAGDRHLDMFLRDDDVGPADDELLELLDICISRRVPVNLEVIPTRLTDSGVALLKELHRTHPGLLELHQHGWLHVNHETEGKKHEFGPSRSYFEQRRDIARGKAVLEERLATRFTPMFTPPWNRCTPDTHRVLDELGFAALSMDRSGRTEVAGYGFAELSISLDLFTWKTGAKLRPTGAILGDLVRQALTGETVGLMLHHEVMQGAPFDLLDAMLEALASRPYVRFHTFTSLLAQPQTRVALGGVA